MAFFNRFLKTKQDLSDEKSQNKAAVPFATLPGTLGQRCKSTTDEQNVIKHKEEPAIKAKLSDAMEGSSLFSGMTINVDPTQSEGQESDEQCSQTVPSVDELRTVQELQDLLGSAVLSTEPVLAPDLDAESDGLKLTSLANTTDKIVPEARNEPANDPVKEALPASPSPIKTGPSKKKKKTLPRPGYANIPIAAATGNVKNESTGADVPSTQQVFQSEDTKDKVSDESAVDTDKTEDKKPVALSGSTGSDSNKCQGLPEDIVCSSNKNSSKIKAVNQDPEHATPLYTIGTPTSSEESLSNGKEPEELCSSVPAVNVYNVSRDDVEEKELGVDDYLFQEAHPDQGSATRDQSVLTQIGELPDLSSRIENLEFEISSDKTKPEYQSNKGVVPELDVQSRTTGENILIQQTRTEDLEFEKSYSDASSPECVSNKDITQELDIQHRTERKDVLIQAKEEAVSLSDSNTGDCNLRDDEENEIGIVEQNLKENLESISDQGLQTQLEISVLNQYSNYSERRLEKEELLRHLQQEESQALVNDNYDLAEEVNVKIDQVKTELEDMRTLLPGEDREVQQLLKLECDMKQKKIEVYNEAQTALVKLKERQSASLAKQQQEKQLKISKDKNQLSSESLRIERDIGHLELDKEHLEKGQAQLEREIADKTCDFHDKRDDLLQKRQEIQLEISSLESKLRLLRVKEIEYTEAIDQEEEKIAEVKREYAPQQNLLEQQRKEIQSSEQVLEKDKSNLQAAQDELEERVRDLQSTEERFANFVERISSVSMTCDESIRALNKDYKDIEEYRSERQLSVMTSDPELTRLRSAVSESDTRVKSLSAQVLQAERALLALKKRLNEIETQISELHEAKEMSKAARNFKEAKRLKEEGDVLNAEGVASQGKAESLQQQLVQDSSSLEEAQTENNKLREQLREKEYKADLNTIQSANQVISSLGKFTDRCKNNRVLNTLIEAELTICQDLIKELCKKHGISNKGAYTDSDSEENHRKGNAESEEPEHRGRCEPEKDNSALDSFEYQEMTKKLDDLEGQLEAVIEIEDYDEADRINQEIIKLETEIEKHKPQSSLE